ncbi:hypothetical protein LIER_40217 [Lithospermum erythrorhizon]|uniref:Uncharacterized protein n=1 Tax=Lithospermum erythrorhizon TaxID=34254 RepID=A0AAV3QSE8_LITER
MMKSIVLNTPVAHLITLLQEGSSPKDSTCATYTTERSFSIIKEEEAGELQLAHDYDNKKEVKAELEPE